MLQPPKVNVAIIGCGLIGTQWDAGTTNTYSLTHAAGFRKNPGAHLIALCDRDPEKVEKAAQIWKVENTYTDPKEMFAEVPIDIAVVASSTSARWTIIEAALLANIKVLVIEKPLASTIEESQKLVTAINATGVKTIVNYSRHWDPSMHQLRNDIRAGKLGSIQRLIGIYGKGLSNNGSHMIDLVAFLLDAAPLKARALGSVLPSKEAHWSDGRDRTWDAQIEYIDQNWVTTNLTMLGTDTTAFTCFELRIIGTRSIWELKEGGRKILCASLQPDAHYAGYTVPGEPHRQPARATEAMDQMTLEAVQLARGEISHSTCDAQTALRTALTVQTILQSAQQNGGWLDLAN